MWPYAAESFIRRLDRLVVLSCGGGDREVKKSFSFRRKVDIFMQGDGRLRSAVTCSLKPRLVSNVKLCLDAASATTFSLDGIQWAETSMSKAAAINSIVRNGSIAGP